MDLLSIHGFRCTNHSPSKTILASGRFDAYNPCSWCGNRRHEGPRGPSFHYVEYGHWEFPFIAEANCGNFSLIRLVDNIHIDRKAWGQAINIQKQRNRIAELGRAYSSRHWTAFSPRDVGVFMGKTVEAGEARYPHEMSATQFFREASNLRADLFELVYELRAASDSFSRETGINDSKLEAWLRAMSSQLRQITKQIDEIEVKRHDSGLAILSNWGFNTVSGGATWDGLKMIARMIFELLRQP